MNKLILFLTFLFSQISLAEGLVDFGYKYKYSIKDYTDLLEELGGLSNPKTPVHIYMGTNPKLLTLCYVVLHKSDNPKVPFYSFITDAGEEVYVESGTISGNRVEVSINRNSPHGLKFDNLYRFRQFINPLTLDENGDLSGELVKGNASWSDDPKNKVSYFTQTISFPTRKEREEIALKFSEDRTQLLEFNHSRYSQNHTTYDLHTDKAVQEKTITKDIGTYVSMQTCKFSSFSQPHNFKFTGFRDRKSYYQPNLLGVIWSMSSGVK